MRKLIEATVVSLDGVVGSPAVRLQFAPVRIGQLAERPRLAGDPR